MASYNLFLASVTTGWTAEGGTALEAVGKTNVEPEEPALTPLLKTAAASAKIEVALALPEALVNELSAGAKIIGLTVHFFGKGNAAKKNLRLGWGANSGEVEVFAPGWNTFSLTQAQAEEQTRASLEALTVVAERLLNTITAYEMYVSVTTEAGGAAVSGSIAQQVALVQSLNGEKIALGRVSQSVGLGGSVSGFKSALGSVIQKLVLRDATSGFKSVGAAVTQRLGLTQFVANVPTLIGTLAQFIGLRQSVSGHKVSGSSVAQTMAAKQAMAGAKTTFGVVGQVLGLLQVLVGGVARKVLTWPYASVTAPVQVPLTVHQPTQLGVTVEVELN